MPSAICNTCGSLVHWPFGQHQKKQQCQCGNKVLTAVKGSYNAEADSWEYTDRKGLMVKNVPRDTLQSNFK